MWCRRSTCASTGDAIPPFDDQCTFSLSMAGFAGSRRWTGSHERDLHYRRLPGRSVRTSSGRQTVQEVGAFMRAWCPVSPSRVCADAVVFQAAAQGRLPLSKPTRSSASSSWSTRRNDYSPLIGEADPVRSFVGASRVLKSPGQRSSACPANRENNISEAARPCLKAQCLWFHAYRSIRHGAAYHGGCLPGPSGFSCCEHSAHLPKDHPVRDGDSAQVARAPHRIPGGSPCQVWRQRRQVEWPPRDTPAYQRALTRRWSGSTRAHSGRGWTSRGRRSGSAWAGDIAMVAPADGHGLLLMVAAHRPLRRASSLAFQHLSLLWGYQGLIRSAGGGWPIGVHWRPH